MKKYRVMLEGKNFSLSSDEVVQKHGFYTTLYVEANNPEEAELKAVNMIKTDKKLTDLVKNDNTDVPMIYLDEIVEIRSFDENNILEIGYTFFIEND